MRWAAPTREACTWPPSIQRAPPPRAPTQQLCPVDETGRLRGVDGVWVADASILPSSPEVNPQLAIMALALGVADESSAPARPNPAASRALEVAPVMARLSRRTMLSGHRRGIAL